MSDITVVITGFQAARIEQQVVEQLVEAVRQQMTDSVDKHVDAIVAQEMAHYSREAVRARIEDAIAEGWQTTNTYGEPIGQRKGLKERIGELLTKADGFSDRETFAQKATREAIAKTLEQEFKKEIEALREQFRAQVDAALKGKLAEALRKSLGLP